MGTGTPTSAHPRTGTPHPLSAQPFSAGVKREREESNGVGTPGPPTGVQNGVNGVPPRAPVPVIAAAKAGIVGARPRPLKKQRVVRRTADIHRCFTDFFGAVGHAGAGARRERGAAAANAARRIARAGRDDDDIGIGNNIIIFGKGKERTSVCELRRAGQALGNALQLLGSLHTSTWRPAIGVGLHIWALGAT
jgi:hypothetical protein